MRNSNETIKALQDLLKSEGWQIIEEYLNVRISLVEKKIFGEAQMEDDETIELLRMQRNDLKNLKIAPDIHIHEAMEGNIDIEPKEYDPYDK